MARLHKRLLSAIAATSLVLATGTIATAVSAAEEAVLIPGATVFKEINPLYPILLPTYPVIGIEFHDDDDPQVVDYSQNALDADRAILDGVKRAGIAVRNTDGDVVVIGESMGSMVAARLAVELANSDSPPSTDDIRFVLIASPEAGIARYFSEGTFIPILNYRVSRIPETPYDTTIVIGEYDGWADPPDRPWNLVALANAILGMAYVHGPTIAAADPLDVPPENTTVVTNSQNGTVTTHLVPTANLPLTQTFRHLGVPDAVVDQADEILRPIVDAGYRRHDQLGDSRPYLSEGRILRNVQNVHEVREREDAQELDVSPGKRAGAEKDDRLDQGDPDVQQPKDDPDAQQPSDDEPAGEPDDS